MHSIGFTVSVPCRITIQLTFSPNPVHSDHKKANLARIAFLSSNINRFRLNATNYKSFFLLSLSPCRLFVEKASTFYFLFVQNDQRRNTNKKQRQIETHIERDRVWNSECREKERAKETRKNVRHIKMLQATITTAATTLKRQIRKIN